MKRRALVISIVALAALTASCSSDNKTASTTPAATATTAAASSNSTAGAPTAATAVTIKDFKFGPAEIHVAVGGTVTWTNNDNQQHTATASGKFDAGTIAPGATGTATFPTAGTYAYICSFHPFMKGTVVVG